MAGITVEEAGILLADDEYAAKTLLNSMDRETLEAIEVNASWLRHAARTAIQVKQVEDRARAAVAAGRAGRVSL